MINKFLRIEGLIIFALATAFYFYSDFHWLKFFLLFFVPVVSMVGYLKNNKSGALIYNLGHAYSSPLIFFVVSFFIDFKLGYPLTLIWIAHIGLDRALGFGLKSSEGFKSTHLGHIGEK